MSVSRFTYITGRAFFKRMTGGFAYLQFIKSKQQCLRRQLMEGTKSFCLMAIGFILTILST